MSTTIIAVEIHVITQQISMTSSWYRKIKWQNISAMIGSFFICITITMIIIAMII